MILSPQQEHALTQLLPVARIATSGIRAGLPVLPRTHTLIIGPSGSGKSYLARALAHKLGLPVLIINVATWVITAARSEPWTLTTISEWLDRLPPGGGVLALDEIDKLQSDSDWMRYVRLEIHDLLDGVIPASAKLPIDPVADADIPVPSDTGGGTMTFREELSMKLRDRVMILGAGAWQSAWRSNARAMGFIDDAQPLPSPPTREQILSAIDPELRQRFRDEVILLPTMMPEDYKRVAKDISRRIPADLLPAWNKEIGRVLRQAADGSLGMRALEELLLKALVLSGAGAEPGGVVESQTLKPPRPEPGIW